MSTKKKPAPKKLERRRFFRIDDEMLLRYFVISQEQKQLYAQRIRTNDDLGSIIPEIIQQSGIANSQNTIFDTQPVKANVSGCGLAFMSPIPMDNGQSVLLEMVLLPKQLHILCIADVVKCVLAPLSPNIAPSKDRPYRLGANFSVIQKEAAEAIIQHVLRREIEIFRESKRHLSG